MKEELREVLTLLDWMRSESIWPSGTRYLWTDAFGLTLLVSLHLQTGENAYLDEAEWLVVEVERVLGRQRGIRIGEADDRDGQYFHYLAMWLFALSRLGRILPDYRARGIALAKEIHRPFVVPGRGVLWKMKEDLSGPYPGYGFGGLDAFDGYVSYRALGEDELAEEIAEMRELMDSSWRQMTITQDLALGMMLWLTHFHPDEAWAIEQRRRSVSMLDRMWVDPPGYFCREPGYEDVKFAFTNYGVSIGLQSVGEQRERVHRLNEYFRTHQSGDEYDRDAITYVMRASSLFPGVLITHWSGAEGT